MTFPTGKWAAVSRSTDLRRGAFTLIELILVMTMMLILLSLAGPSLGRFFRGRALDSEARRLLSLTRYAQTRAVSEGVPMIVWLDPQRGRYGLEAEYTFSGTIDTRAVDYALDSGITLYVDPTSARGQTLVRNSLFSMPNARRTGYQIRFNPDGFVGDNSPASLRLMPSTTTMSAGYGSGDPGVWIAQSYNRLQYEIQTNRYGFSSR